MGKRRFPACNCGHNQSQHAPDFCRVFKCPCRGYIAPKTDTPQDEKGYPTTLAAMAHVNRLESRIRELESTLAAERASLNAIREEIANMNDQLDCIEQDRDKWKSSQQYFKNQLDKEKKAWCDAAAELGRDRASRLQAEDKAWNDAIEAALQIGDETHPEHMERRLRSLLKPSVSPEQEREK